MVFATAIYLDGLLTRNTYEYIAGLIYTYGTVVYARKSSAATLLYQLHDNRFNYFQSLYPRWLQ